MAIFHNGKQIQNLYHNNKQIQSLYHNGVKIYSANVPIDTVLASIQKAFIEYNPLSSSIDNKFIVDQSLKLDHPISQTPHGIRLSFPTTSVIVENAVYGYYLGSDSTSYKASINVPKGVTSATVYNGNFVIKVFIDDDWTIHFESQTTKNSTYAEVVQSANPQAERYDYFRYYLQLDKVTAY